MPNRWAATENARTRNNTIYCIQHGWRLFWLRMVRMDSNKANVLLHQFGLEQLLSDDDDARLWAAVLHRYWPPISDPRIDRAALYFEIGTLNPRDQRGISRLEDWCLKRINAIQFQAQPCLQPISD